MYSPLLPFYSVSNINRSSKVASFSKSVVSTPVVWYVLRRFCASGIVRARAYVCARASESERERGNERARGSEREESERASSTRRAAALRSRDVLWKSFILCACGPATPPHNLRGCPHGWAAGFLPDRSTSFRALAQPARRWWPQRSGVTQIHSGITQRANSAVQSIRGNAKCQNVTQCNAKPSQHQRGAFAGTFLVL